MFVGLGLGLCDSSYWSSIFMKSFGMYCNDPPNASLRAIPSRLYIDAQFGSNTKADSTIRNATSRLVSMNSLMKSFRDRDLPSHST